MNFFSSWHITRVKFTTITTKVVTKVEVKALNVESLVSKKVTVSMALNNKCMKSYRELILKEESVKLQAYGKKTLSNTHF